MTLHNTGSDTDVCLTFDCLDQELGRLVAGMVRQNLYGCFASYFMCLELSRRKNGGTVSFIFLDYGKLSGDSVLTTQMSHKQL